MNDTAETAKPDDPLVSGLERVMLHQAAGRFNEAGRLLDELMVQYPDTPRLVHYKGYNLINMGRPDEGKRLVEDALLDAPDDPVQLADYGALLAQSGDLDTAIEQFRMALETAPNYAIAHSNLGAALVLKTKYGQAIPHLEKAIELDGTLMDAHTNLAAAYIQVSRFDKAVEVLFKALAIDPQSVGAHIQLSNALYRRERYESAEHHARRALELAPNALEAYLYLGNALASSGKIDAAAEALLKVAGNRPFGVAGMSRLIHVRKTLPDSPELAILERYIDQIDKLTEEQQATVNFAAGKAYDDLGDYPTAFEHLRTANETTKKLHPFDRTGFVERAQRLRAFASPALIERCSGEGLTDLAPIFICGMPRSGTTLMDQMFSRHPKVQAGGELRAMPAALQQNRRIRDALEEKMPDEEITADDFNRLGESYDASVRSEGIRSEYVSDKMPSNYLYIGMIALALPRAKFLIMRRHPLDCLFSNYMQHFGQNQPFSTDFGNMAAVYTEFDNMAKYWSDLFPDRVREVRYEAVTEDTEGQMRSVLDFVGLDWDGQVLEHKSSLRQVNTASLAQVREPVYRSSVARWRRYGPLLKDLAAELRPFLTEEELEACGVARPS